MPVETANAAAQAAGLRYITDDHPGLTRRKTGKDFAFFTPQGKRITDYEALARIRHLAIPPAWTDVWICPDPDGHLQATGRDARGRKQYRYHSRWRATRDETKYDKMIAFAKALPKIRAAVDRDLKQPGLTREKVLAAVVKLLETTLIRVGNDEYAKSNKSFGLTTLRDRHAAISGTCVTFDFKGKSGVQHAIDLCDPRLARIIAHCQDLPGDELFQYHDESGNVRDVGSADVNDYLRQVAGEAFTAKDFRTWAGTVLAAMALQEYATFSSKTQANRNIVAAVESVAKKLGNTKAVCRKCYIHPAILDSYLDGTLVQQLKKKVDRKLQRNGRDLDAAETAVLSLLQRRLSRGGRTTKVSDLPKGEAVRKMKGLAMPKAWQPGDRTSSSAPRATAKAGRPRRQDV